MPEGHTVHRIAQDHHATFSGQKCKVSSPQGRFDEGARFLNGRKLLSVEAYGKHLCYRWAGGKFLHIHLGLYGKFRLQSLPMLDPRGQVRVRLVGKEKGFDLNGPNTCRLISENEWTEVQDRLGADPLRADSNVELMLKKICKSRAAIGSILLNQSVIAGVGNIYRSEVLHLMRIHPETPGHLVQIDQLETMWDKLKMLLSIGVKYNRIIIADPKEVGKPRSRMNRQERLLVYKRDYCSFCDSEIQEWILGGRKVFACPKCQLR